MRIQHIFFMSVVVVVGLIAWNTLATQPQKKITIQVSPANPNEMDDRVSVDGGFDNLDGTSTVFMTACGSKIQARILNSAGQKRDPEVLKALQDVVDTACKGVGVFTDK